MSRIAVLDQNMINMIAAGEVIERPASVVKELMENSLDAGAASVHVAVEQGGRKLITVTDNGGGMDAGDLALAFEPHATSKIRTSDDLHSIATFGFRGEALASIAAIAQVRAVSRVAASPQAHCLEIDCGQAGQVTPCSGDLGTSISVRDLFYRLPARHKFLRSAQTEMDHVSEQFIRVALGTMGLDQTGVSPHPAFALVHNGRDVFRLPGDQDLVQRVMGLFPALAEHGSSGFIECRSAERQIEVWGLLGRPEISRANNKVQYLFLNGRFVRDRSISHAIHEAYRGLLEPDRHPVVFLFLRMPTEDFDVNVHPTKIEVRFYESNGIHAHVLGVVRETLLGRDLSMPVRLAHPPSGGSRGGGARPFPATRGVADAMADFLRSHRPGSPLQEGLRERAPAYGAGTVGPVSATASPRGVAETVSGVAGLARSFIQIHDSYIVVQTDDGLAIIDQHALHEKILYEKMARRVNDQGLESQRLLIPQTVALTDPQVHLLEDHADWVAKLGLEIVLLGPHTVAIHSFPSLLDRAEPAAFVRDLVDLMERYGDLEPHRLLEEILSMAACKAAIKAGQRLSDHEIRHLLAEGQAAESASRCPHGRPTTISLSLADLKKQFLRT